MTDNIYDQDEMKDLAAAQPAAISHAQPDNFFGDTIGEMPANPGANETIVPKTTPGRTWKDMLHDGISIDNARESARQRTLAEKANPRMETQQEAQEASFAGAFQHGVGIQNITAIANVMDHFADSYGDQWWSRKAQSLRDSIKDGSGYKPIYESYKQIGGLKDFFGYTKEKLGENLGMMLPSMLGATALGSIGATQGELVGGKFGAKVGGVAGGLVGAAAGNAHLQWSEMREALKREGLEGQDLVRYTDMGGAILVGLDSLFPSFAAMKLGGFARNAIAGKVAGKLVENLRQGGKMRTASEFIKQFGKSLAADAVLETTTELAQQYVTDLKAKEFAGKEITAGDVEKFAKETAPEIIIATLVSTIGLSIPGSAAKSYRDIRDAKADAVVPGAKPATATETAEEEGAPSPAAMDGTPAAEAALGSQPVMEDPSRDPTPNPAAGAAGNGVLQFIRAQGGLLPDGEFAALSADRIPGLVSENGKSLTEMRDALVEAGYLEESGPDQPDLASHDDVYDLVQRAMSGERIVPLADRQADEDFRASLDSKDAHKQLAWAEDSIVLPAIEQYNEETGDPTLGQVYRKLRPDDRIAVIERVRDGEDVVNVVEEIIAANVDTEAVQAMVAVYGPNPELIERVRALLAEQQPDLLHGFDEMLAQFPTRRARVPREPARRPGDQPTELVRGMGGRLKAIAGDAQAFEIALGEMERDRKILKDDAFRIATDFLGKAPKKGTKASYFQAIRAGQIQARSPNNRSIFMREGEGALRTQMAALSEAELADIIERRSMARPKKGTAKEAMVEWLVRDAKEAHENRVAAAGGGGNSYQRAVEAAGQKAAPAGQQTLLGGEGRDILPNEPAVPVSKSVTPAAIVSLIDGSRHADLRTHLKKQGIDVEDYARNFRLADNYPLVAANVVAEKHNATRQTETYETFAKRFTVGAEKLAGVEAVQKAIQSASPQALDAALPKLNKRRLAEMAAKLGVKDKNPIKEIGRRFTHDLREAAKFPHIGEIGLGSPDPAADQARGEQMRNKALAEFAAAADPSVAVPTAEPTATPAAPRDLLMELIQLANSKTPRDQWGAILGVSPKELRTAEKAAIEAGILAYDKRGVARRSPEGQKLSAEGIVAEFNALLDEKMPTTRNAQGVDVPAKKAVENWHNRVKAVIAQVGALPLADAQRIAAALAGRKVNKSEMTSRPKIVSLITDRIDNIADSRIKSAVLSGSAAMIAPGTLAGENVMLTPKAESKVEALQRIVDDAVAGILPAHIRADVVDNIEIGRLAREDELLSLAGIESSIADLAALSTAKQMERDGKNRRAIWDATGWYRGVDSLWRFEINDARARLSPAFSMNASAFIGNVFEHPDLYRAYRNQPFRGKLQTKQGAGDSRYTTFDDNILAQGMDRSEIEGKVLHELQHGIQEREGFAPGTNTFIPSPQALEKAKKIIAKTYGDVLDRVDAIRGERDRVFAEEGVGDRYYALNKKFVNVANERDEITKKTGVIPDPKWLAYFNSAGEVEARNVERRAKMTEEERRASPPWETQDVADEDQFFDDKFRSEIQESLRSSGSDIITETEEMDDGSVVEGSAAAGRKGRASAPPGTAPGPSARPSEGAAAARRRGDARLEAAGVQRIVRQESASLRSDGSVFAGRPTKGARTPAGRDAASAQRPGQTLSFKIDGFKGRVIAEELEPNDIAAGNRGRLLYRVFAEDATQMGENDPALAEMYLIQHPDGAWEIEQVAVKEKRQGVGSKLYAAVETDLGIRMSPSGFLSPQGYAFWQKRSPESVKWHVQSPTFAGEDGNYYFSPRKIKDELSRIGAELRNVNLGIGRAANMRPALRDELIEGYRKERGELIKLWGKLPVEARAETPNMFSLSDDENLNSAIARALGQTDPRAEAISISAKAAEAEARRSGRSTAEVAVSAARHEALEFFLATGLIEPSEWANLRRAARAENWIDETGVRKPYTAHYGKSMGKNQLEDLLLKEAIMEKYGRYRAGNYQPESWLGKIFKRISDFFETIVSGFRKEGFETWEDIFQRVDQGALRRRYEEIYGRTEKVNTQAMIRAGVLPDARGIAQAPGATRAPRPSNAPQTVIQRALGRARPIRALSELMADFQRAAGLSVRTGRIDPAIQRQAAAAGGQANGMYNGVARVRVQRDFDTFAHEASHHLERLLGGQLRASMAAHSHELLPMASPVAGVGNTSLSEGFAEFFRRYLTNEQAARAQAPGFYRAFENLVEAENPRVYWAMQDIQDEYDRFLMGDPLDRGAAQQTVIRRAPGAVGRFFADAERDGFFPTMGDRLYELHNGFVQAVFDQHKGWWLAVRTLLEEVNRVTGQRITLAAVDNPNKLIRLTSHTRAWAAEALKEGFALRARPNGGGVSMHQVLATAFGGTAHSQWNEERMRSFGDYLIARRAVQLYVRFRPQARQNIQAFVAANPQLSFLLPRLPTNIASEIDRPPTAEPLYEHLNRLLRHEQQNPQFRQAAELYYRFNKDMIEFLFEKGLITREEKLEYQQDRDYAPFQRDTSDRETVEGEGIAAKRPARGRDKINKQDVYRRLEGSMRDIINPIQSTVQTTFEVHLRGAINDTLAAMDRLARQAGQAGNTIFERLPPTHARAAEVNIREQLRQAGRAANMSPTDIAMMLTNVEGKIGQNVVTTMFTQQQASEKGEKIVWFFENGKPIPAQLPDGTLGRMMFESLTAVGRKNAGILMDALTWTAGTVRAGTTLSPSFILRNLWNDAISAPMNSRFAWPGYTQAVGLREIRRGGAYHHLYNRNAGMLGGAASQAFNQQTIDRDIRLLRERGFQVQQFSSLGGIIKSLAKYGELGETASRVGIFRAAMHSAMQDGMSQIDAAVEAAHYAHDVMDFSQHGSKTEFIKRIIPFFNAALVGMHRYGKSLTASNDYGNLIQIWNRKVNGLPLSRSEREALGLAAKSWIMSTMFLGGLSMIFYLLGADDDDMKEVPDSIRATHWRVSLNGVLHLLPKDVRVFFAGEDEKTDWFGRLPKPYEIAWFANGVERMLDYHADNDPEALEGFAKDMFEILAPPRSIAGLDLAYGFVLGKDMYSGNDIVPTFEKGPQEKERSEQFGPYTSWAAKQIGDATGISPYYADFVIRSLLSSSGREGAMVAQGLSGEGPMLDIGDYPVAQRFTYNASRSSQSLSTFYNMMTQGEGLNKWFWNQFTEDARSFNSAANTYKDMIAAGGEDSVIASEFLSRINPDQRAYAILSADFEGRGKSKYRNLHPMLNAAEGVRVTNAIMKEVVSGTLIQDKDKKFEEKKPLDREQMRFARNELGHIRKGLAQNALQIMAVDGWRDQKMADVDARFKVLKAGAPEVYDELMRRLKKEKVQEGAHLAKVWPKVKERIEASRKDADLGDLYGPIVGE